jgi:RNA 2',3'-cyclic 3'-phosphodiesterase
LSPAAPKELARVFFALWPSAEVRDALAALAREVQAECGGRATRPDTIHLTLFFVGAIERTRMAALQTIANTVASAPFELVIDRLGYFRRARVAWAGAVCPPPLASLVVQLTAKLAAEGIGGEDRPYVPHITLSREAARKPARASIDPVIWRAHDFVLVESMSRAGGSFYEILQRWSLR